jgi:hypothetical protein
VYANIYNYAPYVASGNVFGYVMLRSLDGSKYAQVGWNQGLQGHRWTLIEWTHDGTWTRHAASPQAVGTFSYYTMLYNNTPGKFSFQVNSTTLETQDAQFSPNASEIMGEVQTGSSQMPGGSGQTERFYDSHKFTNGAWHSYDGSIFNSNGSWYSNSKTSVLNDAVWDKACSS